MTMPLTQDQMAEITRIKDRMRVSKVVATRSVKTARGDFFVGQSSAWDTTQEDAGGPGADLIDALGPGEQQQAIVQRGMTLREAKIAGLILGMQVDLQAHQNAWAGGAISDGDLATATRAIRRNYMNKLAEAVSTKNGGSSTPEEGGEG
jgi:hypothetical protein